ncbi:hypothetical protein E1171_02040 [Cytophagales bacterium RKSG123]|nr:hypothetical protein [Xanthovirga aplysinae]
MFGGITENGEEVREDFLDINQRKEGDVFSDGVLLYSQSTELFWGRALMEPGLNTKIEKWLGGVTRVTGN